MKKNCVSILALILSILFFSFPIFAQQNVKSKLDTTKPKDFPKEPIEFVVVYPAGGGMDVTARILAKYVEKYIDQRVVVVNKTGGGGMVGHTYLATQAKNDGYTVGIVANLLFNDELLRAKGAWGITNFEFISLINSEPTMWITSNNGPLAGKSIKEIIEYAKKEPNKVRVAIVPENDQQFMVEQVESAAGVQLAKVPFQGGKPGIVSMLGNHIEISGWFMAEVMANLEAKEVSIIAVTGENRAPNLPNVPTLNETVGVNNINWGVLRFAVVPKGVPKERTKYLDEAIQTALHDPECIKEFESIGAPCNLRYMGAEAITKEVYKYNSFLKEFFLSTNRIQK